MNQYDGAAGVKADRFDARIPKCLDLMAKINPSSVLDIGCGDGFFLDLLRQRGLGNEHLAGLEISETAANTARERGFDCRALDAESTFPFESMSFDAVFAGEVVEHLSDPDALLSEALRVLTPGGALLLTTPNLAAWFNRLLIFAGITPMFVEHSYKATYGPAYSLFKRIGHPVGHLRIFTLTPLIKVIEQNGFQIEGIVGTACLPIPIIHKMDRLLASLRVRLAANFIVLCRKPLRQNDDT